MKKNVVETLFGKIKISNSRDVHISHVSNTELPLNEYVDIRQFSLYMIDGVADNKKKPTYRGVRIEMCNLEYLIRSLIKLYNNMSGKTFKL
jgi:hypothetical protein